MPYQTDSLGYHISSISSLRHITEFFQMIRFGAAKAADADATRPVPIALSVCRLLGCVLWLNGAIYVFCVYRSRIGTAGRHFYWYHIRQPRSNLNTQTGVELIGHNLKLNSGQMAADI